MTEKFATLTLAGVVTLSLCATSAFAKRKHKSAPVNFDDSTSQLYQLLNDSHGGKLKDFCILAGLYKDSQSRGEEFQRVLSVDYNKNNFFGRLQIHVRSVAKLTPAQLKTYTPRQIFKFAVSDTQTFEKIHVGPFGEQGDLYLRATDSEPPRPAPITNQIRQRYANLITQYILPALQKQP
jgi:hypothetical protein